MRLRGVVLSLAAILSMTGAVRAQDVTTPARPLPILTLNTERLYEQSRYAQQIRAGLDADTAALNAENDRIVADLTEEERSLTQRRPTLTPEAFRTEALEFDVRVQAIRRARDAKELSLQQAQVTARTDFFAAAQQVIGTLMLERGAVVVLDERSVYLSLAAGDITDAAIARVDAVMLDGDGGGPLAGDGASRLIDGATLPAPVTPDDGSAATVLDALPDDPQPSQAEPTQVLPDDAVGPDPADSRTP
ncbi:periplasmic chaperone for outer membrane proteins Skp [Loktanella fryxellensis]|uniref:Periplasmic chaperone for outer membrane proteins Skp n=1 Tax=Loktanella fryxellensis TaxID=245187 RepID=A0A1H8ICK0_9RHOB|nr:OmpH family outer membrane protein [Loktanella fryxellensis]SEN66184.1 periplasmic chaperone for outer membrane proteins Skp [Loktanella fryxellensis]